MRTNGLKLTFCGLLACATLGAAAPRGVAAETADAAAPSGFGDSRYMLLPKGEIAASSMPSEERELAFPMPGLIDEVSVKDGDLIKAGQVLAKQDTDVEQAALAREEFLLKSNVQKAAAVEQRNLAEVKFKRAERLLKDSNGAGSQMEYDEAKLELTIAELKIKLADEETESKRLEIVKLKKQIARMTMVSRFDGQVRKVESEPGEVSDPQKPSLIVVRNDPLHVEVNVPTVVANALKVGQPMQVRYVEEGKWREAKIKNFDPVANASVGETLVRLELPNPEKRRSGQQMAVKLPENVAAAR
jgi:RND family efflux transporter MFP subunit